jgi:hypothetical protein
MSSLETVAYDSALRSLDEQERVVDELRARTGLVLAASSLAASFLGRSAFAGGPPALLGLALAAFAVSIGTGVYVLLPKSTFVFALAGGAVYEGLYEFRDDLEEVHRRLAYDLDAFWRANDAALAKLLKWFRLSVVTLALEVAFLLGAVGDNLL